MSIAQIFVAGGVVMWPLLAFSIVALALIAERCVFWFRVQRRQRRVVREVLALYPQDSSAALFQLRKHAGLPIARIFLAALELEQAGQEEFRLALESEAQAELPTLRRFNTVFETIVTVAPLLGLLGTVLGLINSFASLRLGDLAGSNTANVTAGISEALISTATGLVVAIVTLLFSNLFKGFYLRQKAQIQEYGGHLELLHRRHYAQGVLSYATTR
ncbi:biopolymer transporter ExbB [Leptolyngbya sp. 'hensonii']|uniref:MotA/TolQ/ExbB proton channel family protein n=1 Tax=Leptolyngbya sp. 'hensonii' TaxID=1922337 RepID=UPI00094F5349|nr:MotA/TolQ/ExbB proton channel family protein [Leptolyngbya sp. 'hensonii']OLP17003.1 biopolymer transporter ExbB [Leptolyngbya sp. 'hensonii']